MPRGRKKKKEENEVIENFEDKKIKETIDQKETPIKNENTMKFEIDVSQLGILPTDAELLVNNSIKYYINNKNIIENNLEKENQLKDGINNIINEYEKSIKFYNYIPKTKILKFINNIKEILG